MLDIVNALACALMLALTVPIAVDMPAHGFWRERVAFALSVAVLGLQVVGPVMDWLPPANALQAMANVALVVALWLLRRDIMAFARVFFRIGTTTREPTAPTMMSDHHQLARARGRGLGD